MLFIQDLLAPPVQDSDLASNPGTISSIFADNVYFVTHLCEPVRQFESYSCMPALSGEKTGRKLWRSSRIYQAPNFGIGAICPNCWCHFSANHSSVFARPSSSETCGRYPVLETIFVISGERLLMSPSLSSELL